MFPLLKIYPCPLEIFWSSPSNTLLLKASFLLRFPIPFCLFSFLVSVNLMDLLYSYWVSCGSYAYCSVPTWILQFSLLRWRFYMDDVFNLKRKEKQPLYWSAEQFVVTSRGEHRILKIDLHLLMAFLFFFQFWVYM